jgi:NADH-quinone oxidoreductase subunit F
VALTTNSILICAGGGCISAGEESVKQAFERKLKEYGLDSVVSIVETGCMGACSLGPLAVVYPDGVYYQKLTPKAAEKIVEEHILKGRIVPQYLFEGSKDKLTVEEKAAPSEIPFFARQVKIALRNVGVVDPLNIEEYIARDGYFALNKALTKMTPEDVIKEIKDSGLRGRGGAGFPTAIKWDIARKQKSDVKYMICNADEGDPGAFMDRSVLEGDPHSIVEAMTIAGYAIGAQKGFVYVRAEYPLAIERLGKAIETAHEYGFLGENIMGSNFSFDIEIRIGAGAFVCGEETALMQSVEGKRGQPRVKPPFPAEKGLWGKPSVINNVETLAMVAPIILRGASWFRQYGTEKSPGTKVFALAGKIKNTGLVEVPMGITLRELLYEIGGGHPQGKQIKAVQTGGPSGGVIPAEYFDTPVDYESLAKLGAIMGSGGMIVLDEDDCMVDVAKFFLGFTVEESCGKCTPCREGTKVMHDLLEKITSGEGTMEDIDKLEQLAQIVRDSSLCGLGQTAPNPVLSTLKYYRHEYEAHVKDNMCLSKKCKAFISYVIAPDKCTGCTACARVCPSSAIYGEVRKVHEIDQDACIRCGSCIEVCRFGAISKVTPAVENVVSK